MNLNYLDMQNKIRKAMVGANAYPVIIKLLNNVTISTIGVFTYGVAKNTDNRQNPTWATGETLQKVIVPGIDFVGAVNAGVTTTPQVGGTVEWTRSGVAFKKIIESVGAEVPIPNVPLFFTLGIG
jgi:hypothetical protein